MEALMALTTKDILIEKIAEKDKGYLLTRDILRAGISHVYFYDFLERHPEYTRQENGVYINESIVTPDYFYILSLHKKKLIFCGMSACYLLGLTGSVFLPSFYEVTFPSGYNRNRLKGKETGSDLFIEGKNLKVFYAKPKDMEAGSFFASTPLGHEVKVYQKEKAICQVIKNKNDYEPKLYRTVIRSFFSDPNVHTMQLTSFAREYKVYEQVMDYINLFYDIFAPN